MESILSLRKVVKKYHNHIAVNEVTFDIPKGSIFGLLGPNGAGKTSLIRIVTKITGADAGEIFLDGELIQRVEPSFLGYLPEERGLYKKMKVGEQLMYLAQLKGLSASQAKEYLKVWFNKFEINDWWNKKVQELSKGMQQKIQFIATVVHKPKLLILDEPFSGLDPINTNLIKDEIRKLNENGTSVIFSTHRMEQVEEMCRDIVLIDDGKNILEGKVDDIKEAFKENLHRIEFRGALPVDLTSIGGNIVSKTDNSLVFKINDHYNSNDLLARLINGGFNIRSYQEILPSLNEIFIKKVEAQDHE